MKMLILNSFNYIFCFWIFSFLQVSFAFVSYSSRILRNNKIMHKLPIYMSNSNPQNNDIPGIIIGGNGRIGNFLYEANLKKDIILSRDQPFPSNIANECPIYIATRNDDLESIIDKIPMERRKDLVFLQNGVLKDFLMSKGLENNTQGLIYFAVSKKGEKPIDGITRLNPNGLTAVTGKWASDFSNRLSNAGLTCSILDKSTWEISMFEKHIWICTFMIIGTKYKCNVETVVKAHKNEVVELILELESAISKLHGVSFDSSSSDRLLAYGESVGHFPTALKEFKWRNGWFDAISKSAIANGDNDPCPLHSKLLRELS